LKSVGAATRRAIAVKQEKGISVPTEIPYLLLTGPMGLEPTASGVTGG